MTLPANLRRRREAAGLTPEDVAQRLEVARNSVYRWESRDNHIRQTPSEVMKAELAALYGCKVADFYEEKKDE